jgi:hypothetical protein
MDLNQVTKKHLKDWDIVVIDDWINTATEEIAEWQKFAQDLINEKMWRNIK